MEIEDDLKIELIFDKTIQIISEFLIELNQIQKTIEWIGKSENREKDIEAEFVSNFCDNFTF